MFVAHCSLVFKTKLEHVEATTDMLRSIKELNEAIFSDRCAEPDEINLGAVRKSTHTLSRFLPFSTKSLFNFEPFCTAFASFEIPFFSFF